MTHVLASYFESTPRQLDEMMGEIPLKLEHEATSQPPRRACQPLGSPAFCERDEFCERTSHQPLATFISLRDARRAMPKRLLRLFTPALVSARREGFCMMKDAGLNFAARDWFSSLRAYAALAGLYAP